MPFTKGENKCAWIYEGRTDLCGLSCRGKYCHVHNAPFKKGGGTKPCLGCNCGLRGKFPICTRCGGKAYRSLLVHYQTRNTPNIKNINPPTPEEYLEFARNKRANTASLSKLPKLSTPIVNT